MTYPSRTLRFTLLLIAVLLLGLQSSLAFSRPVHAQSSNPIVLENQNPGSSGWQIDYNIGRISDDRANQIKGYASATSINHGSSINFYVTVNPVQNYRIDVYRMGWYGGAGGRLMQSVPNLAGVSQSACPTDPTTGMVECNWQLSYTLAVPANWTTGIYLAKLTNAEGWQSYIVFAVRDDNRVADFLYQQPVNTYQAYNNYPNNEVSGKSLYDFNSFGPPTALGTQRAVKVSFNRPYGGNGGADGGGEFAGDEWWERYFISWAERMGYDISYTTDVDMHANGGRLLNFKGYLSVGHSEYWSKQMYDAVEAARNNGVNLAFFGANSIYWQVRYEPSSSGVPNRVLVGYKSSVLDPITDPALKTDLWRYVGRAEQQLVGVQFAIDGDFSVTQPYIIKNSSHWVWANTGFGDNSVVPGLLGYEVDRLFSEYPQPVGSSYTTLAESPYTAIIYTPPIQEISQSSIYQANSGAWVFATGTMAWPWGLDRSGYVSTGILRATQNILDRFLLSNATPTATPLPPTATPTATPLPLTATPTNTLLPPTATPTAATGVTLDPNKTYKIISRASGKLVSANPSLAATNGQKIIQYSDVGASSQQWSFASAGNGYYYIVSKQTGRVLDINGSTQTAGEQLQLWQLNNGANQQWRIVNSSTPGYVNIIVRHSGLYMDVSGSGLTDYTSILQWPGTGNSNQQWQIVEVTTSPTPTATPTPLSGTVDKRISQGSDDAEESKSSGTMTTNSADIELGYDLGLTNTYQWSGLRFQNITVPRGATITSAYIEFTVAAADYSLSSNLTIRGHAADNTAAFTTARSNISSRARTSASVAWKNVPLWLFAGSKDSTPELKSIVQEIVNRSGWNSGNSISFVIDGTGRRPAYAYEGRASSAARLVIKWTSARSELPDIPQELTPTPSAVMPSLMLDYTSGAPGSLFTVVGQHYAPNAMLDLLVAGQPLATVQTNENGDFVYIISTTERSEGTFLLSVAGQSDVSVSYQVAQNLPLHLPTPDAGEYPMDEESVQKVYLPVISSDQ